jgi:presequence protease
MKVDKGFRLLWQRRVEEIDSLASFYVHEKTGAEVLSLENSDENKVFGISFRTPPSDSTGVAHILEHSVLCGSRKYPSKEPFVELLKGSLQTFLNAMTYPDKTCYPVASQNVTDFYNLVDVYLDAVFFPKIDRHIFQQEGWHYDLDSPKGELSYKGVVFNEMKGAYSSPDSLIAEHSQQALFPDTTYGLDSGGHPLAIPDLTYEEFVLFHRKFYNPTNARIFFSGDDEPGMRLSKLAEYLDQFEAAPVHSEIAIQSPYSNPWKITRSYQVSPEEESPKGFVTINWLLADPLDPERNLALHILEHILIGMPGSPLRKRLIDSGLGEDLTGQGLESELRQMFFSTGLKGVDPGDMEAVHDLILQGLTEIVEQGLDPRTVQAAVNTIEFRLRENNAGSYPRGLLVMLRSLGSWLYGGDPLSLIAFEEPLGRIKGLMAEDKRYFERLIRSSLIENPHRATVFLRPDPKFKEGMEQQERERLETFRKSLSDDDLSILYRDAETLRAIQETPDPPEVLETIPRLSRKDLDRQNKTIPLTVLESEEYLFLVHDLPTTGITYLDLGFDLHALPQNLLPYVPLFGKALLEMGTRTEDFVSLSQRISSETGGIDVDTFTSGSFRSERGEAWLLFRGKAVDDRTGALLEIFKDVLLEARLDDRERFRQILLEEKASLEQSLIPSGHRVVDSRLRARFTESDWADETMSGVSSLFFLRYLIGQVEREWDSVVDVLEAIRRELICRDAFLLNATMDGVAITKWREELERFAGIIPQRESPARYTWVNDCTFEPEGMTLPAQVNYVGKGFDLYKTGYGYKGSGSVISRYTRTSWLWEQIRVRGGAYGAFCNLDRMTGIMTFVSYRDPNLNKTLNVFDQTAEFLRTLHMDEGELTKAVVGAVGDLDRYLLPDAKGYVSMLRFLTGDTDQIRQTMRDEILATSGEEFRDFADHLQLIKDAGLVSVLGSAESIEEARNNGLALEHVFQVL